jgi:hypothetical protein
MWDNISEFIVDNRVDTQVKLRKMGWNNKEMLLKINIECQGYHRK